MDIEGPKELGLVEVNLWFRPVLSRVLFGPKRSTVKRAESGFVQCGGEARS